MERKDEAFFNALGKNDHSKLKNHITKWSTSNEKLFHSAAKRGWLDTVKSLLHGGVDANARNGDKAQTALHLMSESGLNEGVKFLIEEGAEINVKDVDGSTPLKLSCLHGHVLIVKLLLEHGADVNATDNSGMTALEYSFVTEGWNSSGNRREIVQLLLDFQANINVEDKVGRSIITQALCKPIFYAQIIIRHIVLLQSANSYVSEKVLKDIDNSYQTKRCKDLYVQVIEKMKNSQESEILWKILVSDFFSLFNYLKNPYVIQHWRSGNFKNKFTLYSEVFTNKIEIGLRRGFLMNKVKLFFEAITKAKGNGHLPILPSPCVEKIFSYFNYRDFKSLIKVCDPCNTIKVENFFSLRKKIRIK